MSLEHQPTMELITIDPTIETVQHLGATVFERLAQEQTVPFELPKDDDGNTILNSVTRLGDGQTVRDEN